MPAKLLLDFSRLKKEGTENSEPWVLGKDKWISLKQSGSHGKVFHMKLQRCLKVALITLNKEAILLALKGFRERGEKGLGLIAVRGHRDFRGTTGDYQALRILPIKLIYKRIKRATSVRDGMPKTYDKPRTHLVGRNPELRDKVLLCGNARIGDELLGIAYRRSPSALSSHVQAGSCPMSHARVTPLIALPKVEAELDVPCIETIAITP
ncbi:hypothetical protein VNO77_44190 [Canavalia gladiata]|uniref:Uncharacterized protein n=1 Tax=Canavalia gladiata TaxID=3824 RepID=A0AAN9JZ79_CANGL